MTVIMECGILTIKKTPVKTFQIELHPVFFKSAHLTHTGKRKRKKLTVKEKTFFYLNFSSIATLKKQR